MTPFNPEQDERVPPIYGDSAMYIEPPVGDNQRNGVVPLDTLPAQWWNWLWNNVTKYCNAVVNPEIHDIVNELTNVLSAAGMTPDSVNQDQLLRAIRKIVDDTTATTSQKGVVKASNANGKVSVDNDGVMTANGLGDVAQLTTAIKTSVVNALNEVVTNIGALSGLSTTAKTDIVAAINELVTSLSTLNNNKVPNTRTVNGKALSEDITLSATDVGALPSTTPIPAAQVNSDWNASSGVAQILNKPTIPTDYPPKNHASTDTTYGVATSSQYGHVRLGSVSVRSEHDKQIIQETSAHNVSILHCKDELHGYPVEILHFYTAVKPSKANFDMVLELENPDSYPVVLLYYVAIHKTDGSGQTGYFYSGISGINDTGTSSILVGSIPTTGWFDAEVTAVCFSPDLTGAFHSARGTS